MEKKVQIPIWEKNYKYQYGRIEKIQVLILYLILIKYTKFNFVNKFKNNFFLIEGNFLLINFTQKYQFLN